MGINKQKLQDTSSTKIRPRGSLIAPDPKSQISSKPRHTSENREDDSRDERAQMANSEVLSLGADIRALRRSRSMTLQDFAKYLDRSVGFVSQIERGLSEPSISDLRIIANIFAVPLSLFFAQSNDDPVEQDIVVRAGHRRILGGEFGDLKEELLSPNLGGSFEILRCEFAPGSERLDVQPRDTEEAGYLISGNLEIQLDEQWFTLNPGDSFSSNRDFNGWRNPFEVPAIVIWVISPPIY